jgi:hypothetical protein
MASTIFRGGPATFGAAFCLSTRNRSSEDAFNPAVSALGISDGDPGSGSPSSFNPALVEGVAIAGARLPRGNPAPEHPLQLERDRDRYVVAVRAGCHLDPER